MPRQTNNYVQVYLHFVWGTKLGLPNIDSEIESALAKIFHAKAHELDMELISFGGTEDHIHILIKTNATLSPHLIAKHFKGASSHYINHVMYPDGSKNFYWQGGYGVISVSPKDVSMIRKYIQNQKDHHAQSRLIRELEMS